LHTLRSYFETDIRQRKALAGLYDAWGGLWDVSGSLHLYEASHRAFDPSSNAEGAFGNFKVVYDVLKSSEWQVFRPQSPENCWSPQQIFETIKAEFTDFGWSGPVDLLNFPKSGSGLRLESRLAKMKGIKRKSHYPLMTVSKFLHFYNPTLFPIYDTAIIWNRVLNGHFKTDYRSFCERERVPTTVATGEDTAAFLRYYMILASSLLAVAHGSFMQVFVDWLARQPGAELSKRNFNPLKLYATAFEFTVIGATAD
jgi:hypothetical protein